MVLHNMGYQGSFSRNRRSLPRLPLPLWTGKYRMSQHPMDRLRAANSHFARSSHQLSAYRFFGLPEEACKAVPQNMRMYCKHQLPRNLRIVCLNEFSFWRPLTRRIWRAKICISARTALASLKSMPCSSALSGLQLALFAVPESYDIEVRVHYKMWAYNTFRI